MDDDVQFMVPLDDEQAKVFAALHEMIHAYARAVEVIHFYADPATYHGIGFMLDPPCGDLVDDAGDDVGNEWYDNNKPGKRARDFLRAEGLWHGEDANL